MTTSHAEKEGSAGGGAAGAEPERDPAQLERFREALELASEGAAERAVPLLKALIAEAPDYIEAYEVLGVSHDKLGQLDEGIAVLQEMVRRDPDAKMGWVNLSRLYVQKGLIDEAEEAKAKATVAAMKELAREKKASGTSIAEVEAPPAPAAFDDVDANAQRIAMFEAAVEEDPTNDIALFSLGQMYARLGEDERVVDRLTRLVTLRPDYSAAYLPLGEALVRLGRTDEAVRTYQKGIEIADGQGDMVPRNKMRARMARLNR